MREKGTDPEDLIDAYMMQHPEVTHDEASKEVVAEAMTDILPESQFVQKLAQKKPGIFKKLLERLKAFVKEIKDHFARMGDTASPEVAAVKEDIDGVMRYAEKIVEAFDRVAVGAVENYQKGAPAQKNTAEGGVQYQAKHEKVASYKQPITMADIAILRSIGRKSINQFTPKDLNKAEKWAYKFYKELQMKPERKTVEQ